MRILLAILVMASMAYGQGRPAPEQGPPPTNLTRRADGHVTANEDPANPERFEVYTVQAGDTLSQIAGRVLNNARLWPQLWEQNEHIINPHWIYPADRILIRPITLITEAAPPLTPQPEPIVEPEDTPPANPQQPVLAQPASLPPMFDFGTPRHVSEIKPGDMYCSGFVRMAPLPQDLKVISNFNAEGSVLSASADYIYISQGAEDGVTAGSRYQVIRATRRLDRPGDGSRSERELGMHYLDVGHVQVMVTRPDFSIARVMHACDAVEVGDIMMPLAELTVPEPPRNRPFSPVMMASGPEGQIVISRDVLLNNGSLFKGTGIIPGVGNSDTLGGLARGMTGAGGIVYIDVGQADGVQPGDSFIVFRISRFDSRLYDLPKEAGKLDLNRTAIGELIILKVGERASTAIVTYATDGISAGDVVGRR